MRRNNAAGFTLVEVLIALALSAVLVTVLFSALHTYTLSASAGHESLAGRRLEEAVYQFVRKQLREIIPLTLKSPGFREVLFFGGEHEIVYVGRIPSYRSAGGLHRNSLTITGTPPEQSLTFGYERLSVDKHVDRASVIEGGAAKSRTLLSSAGLIEFEYFGTLAADEPKHWMREWQRTDELPELIRIWITSANGEKRISLVAPIYANIPTRHVAMSISHESPISRPGTERAGQRGKLSGPDAGAEDFRL